VSYLGVHSPDEVYHVTVMPCYDKKLEASRSDFYNEQYATRDVDCVLTTGELLLLAQEHGVDLSLPIPDEDVPPSPTLTSGTPVLPDLLTPPGTSSGSYLHSLMLAIARTSPHPLTLESKTVRSADYVEHTLRDTSSGAHVFRGATCYGFRNLQNVVRRVGRTTGVQVGRGAAGRLAGGLRSAATAAKRTGAAAVTGGGGAGTAAYDYVEVMACPGGCVGGGGQLRAPDKRKTATASNSTSTHDAEGFVRDWAADGVRPGANGGAELGLRPEEVQGQGPGQGQAPWSSRAWTRHVERAYWDGPAPELEALLPTPPASPVSRGSSGVEVGAEPAQYGAPGVLGGKGDATIGAAISARPLVGDREAELERQRGVEALVMRALRELCAPAPEISQPRNQQEEEVEAEAETVASWEWSTSTGLVEVEDETAEARRRGLFRTQYRAVESEVVGLGVKW